MDHPTARRRRQRLRARLSTSVPTIPASPPSRSNTLTPVAGVARTAGQLVSPRLGQRNLRWLRGVTRRRRGATAVRRSRVVRRQPAPRSGLLTGLDSPLQAGLNDLAAPAGNSCPLGDGGRQWWWAFGTLRLSSGRGGGVWRGTFNRAVTSARTDRGRVGRLAGLPQMIGTRSRGYGR